VSLKMKKYRLKGQSTLEYAFLVAIVAAAVIAMQFYIKRALEGRIKQSGDEISEPYDSELMQWSSIRTSVQGTTTINTDIEEVDAEEKEFNVNSRITQRETVSRTGSEHLNPW
jgi:Flp pilus assembly pilin Flp